MEVLLLMDGRFRFSSAWWCGALFVCGVWQRAVDKFGRILAACRRHVGRMVTASWTAMFGRGRLSCYACLTAFRVVALGKYAAFCLSVAIGTSLLPGDLFTPSCTL